MHRQSQRQILQQTISRWYKSHRTTFGERKIKEKIVWSWIIFRKKKGGDCPIVVVYWMGLTTLDYLIVCWWEAVAMVLRRRQNSVGKRNFLSLQLRTVPLALEGRKDDGPFVSALLLLSFASLTQTLNSPVVWRIKIKNKAQRRFFGKGFSRASINHWVANFRSWWSGHCSTHLFHHITRQQRPKECWWCALYSSDAGSKLSGYYITRSGGKMDPGPSSINGQSTCNGFSLGSACHAVCSPFFFFLGDFQ
jgi:hypothetical protein